MKWNESGFRPPLCTYRLNWARRTSWGWWDDWDDTVLQTQDSKFVPWRSEAEHATSRSRRLPTILTTIFKIFQNTPQGTHNKNVCVYWVERSPANARRWTRAGWCWASVADCGPTLDQHWVNVVFAGRVGKCFAPKWNNKFRLIHSLYCPLEPFNNINYKSHSPYTY